MKPTDITVERFVETYLPDCERRFVAEHLPCSEDMEVERFEWFARDHFPEALRAYSERICREQREICQMEAVKYPLLQRDAHHRNAISNIILNAPTPEITTKTE